MKAVRLSLLALSFAGICYVGAFGSAVLCCAPVSQLARASEKFWYGLIPVVICVSLVLTLAREWLQTFQRRRNAVLVGSVVILASFMFDLAVWWRSTVHSIDNEIRIDWHPDSGSFTWGRGEVRLPAQSELIKEHGIDTEVGRFASRDGVVEVRYDIGTLAGEHGGIGAFETIVAGSRVHSSGILPDGAKYFARISFPDNGCANFDVESLNRGSTAATADLIARTFRPHNRAPAWALPVLPEILRRDCRYRFRSPFR